MDRYWKLTMTIGEICAAIGIIGYGTMSILHFRKSDLAIKWGYGKEYLAREDRVKWQRNEAFRCFECAFFGTIVTLLLHYLDSLLIQYIVSAGFLLFLLTTGAISRTIKK